MRLHPLHVRCLTALLLCVLAIATQAAPTGYAAHYLVVHESADGRLTLAGHQVVQLAGQPAGNGEDGAAPVNRLQRRIQATTLDKNSGAAVASSQSAASAWLRAEFQSAGETQINGRALPTSERDYVVRVPLRANSLLRLRALGDGSATSANGQALAAAELLLDLDRLPQAQQVTTTAAQTGALYANGSPSNRLDLLIVGDGYTASQQAAFLADAKAMADSFFAISPYREYRHLANVSWLFLPSNQAGADKPACAETPSQPATQADTAFDARFCTSGLRRLVTVNEGKVYAAAAAMPDWDRILVLVNDKEYGGSGGSVVVATTNPQSVGIMRHEFGHSFTQLADEYDSAYPGYPPCSDLTGSSFSPCEANVTNQTNPALLKWKSWLATATPIPSTGALKDPLETGLWAGARYLSSGMYRQCYNGIMRSLSDATGADNTFCHVDAEAFVKQLYGGGWGVPSAGIKLAEPAASPAPTSTLASGSCVALKATLSGSLSGLGVAWTVDGKPLRSGSSQHGAVETLLFQMPDAATHLLQLTVTDNTPLALAKPSGKASWTLQPQAGATPDYQRLMNWAEKKFPALFSPAASTQASGSLQFRYYPASASYLAVMDCQVYVMGSVFGGLVPLGAITDLMPLVAADGF